jgi:signal transduction histidine kinase
VAVEPIIDSCLAMRQQQFADAEIVPIVEIAPDLPDVVADRTALAKCLLAIIDNAIKFSDGAPQILVSADRVEGPGRDHDRRSRHRHPEEYLDRVTEPSSRSITASPRARAAPASASRSPARCWSARTRGCGS